MDKKTLLKRLTNLLVKMKKDRWTYLGDLWDIEKAIKFVKQNKMRQAADLLDDLDTDVREKLPSSVWDWVIDTAHPEKVVKEIL